LSAPGRGRLSSWGGRAGLRGRALGGLPDDAQGGRTLRRSGCGRGLVVFSGPGALGARRAVRPEPGLRLGLGRGTPAIGPRRARRLSAPVAAITWERRGPPRSWPLPSPRPEPRPDAPPGGFGPDRGERLGGPDRLDRAGGFDPLGPSSSSSIRGAMPRSVTGRSRTRRSAPAGRLRHFGEIQRAGALHLREIRRRPTLPGGLPPSTIGAGGLHFRVRNGNGCYPAAMATGNLVFWVVNWDARHDADAVPRTPERARTPEQENTLNPKPSAD
jgi:hypothetical protein